MRVTVFGLWHLGCVTAACLAEAGHQVVGLDLDTKVVDDLRLGQPPLEEPGLAELIHGMTANRGLSFTSNADGASRDAEVLWVAFDTPVGEDDQADVAWLREQLEAVATHLRPGTLVVISSQVPVGFTANLERDWVQRGLRFAVSPENLRLGKALECFRKPERIVVGCRGDEVKSIMRRLVEPFCKNLLFMSIESAEMTKHALNAFLATSVAFINELSRLCEAVGADAKEVERGLKSEGRIGPKAYLSPGAAFAGGTLARDVRFLIELGESHKSGVAFFHGVWDSNNFHKHWARAKLGQMVGAGGRLVAAILGLTYKPGTNTLRRSPSVELCRWLGHQNIEIKVHDPAIKLLPADLDKFVKLCDSPAAALSGSDVAVIATPWPEYKELPADVFVRQMRRARVLDQEHFLAATLAADPRIEYQATGLPGKTAAA